MYIKQLPASFTPILKTTGAGNGYINLTPCRNVGESWYCCTNLLPLFGWLYLSNMESGISRDLFHGHIPGTFSEITEDNTHRACCFHNRDSNGETFVGLSSASYSRPLKTPKFSGRCSVMWSYRRFDGGEVTAFCPEGRVYCVLPKPG